MQSYRTIYRALLALAQEEGVLHAIHVAQAWQTALEDMGEAASTEELRHIRVLLGQVNAALGTMVSPPPAPRLPIWLQRLMFTILSRLPANRVTERIAIWTTPNDGF